MAKAYRHVILFEDDRVSNLYPLTLTRPAWELRCGKGTLLDRVRTMFPEAEISVWVRDYLAENVAERFAGLPINELPKKDGVLINSRLLDLSLLACLPDPGDALVLDGIPVAAEYRLTDISPWYQGGGTAAVLDGLKYGGDAPRSSIVEYPWQLTRQNAALLIADLQEASKPRDFPGEVDRLAVLRGEDQISAGAGTTIAPFAVIDGTTGPIVMGRNVAVESHALIQGPAFIGDGSVIRSHARIYGNVSFGTVCKVGGEVHSTIIHDFTNKQHDGFLGNSIVGSWCNLGAGTTISNLKNNYSQVKVQVGDRLIDTGFLFVGSVIGDHSTTAIGTILNTGTVIGVGCSLFGAGFPPRFVPSFRWGGAGSLKRQSLDKAVSAMEPMMARRQQVISETYLRVLKQIYRMTEHDEPLGNA